MIDLGLDWEKFENKWRKVFNEVISFPEEMKFKTNYSSGDSLITSETASEGGFESGFLGGFASML